MICVSTGGRPTETPVRLHRHWQQLFKQLSQQLQICCCWCRDEYLQQHLGGGKHRPPCVATAVLRPWEELIGVESGVDQILPLLTKTPTPPSPAFISQLNGLTPCYFLISDFSPAVVGKRGHIFSVFISMFSFRFWRVDRKKENNLNCEIRKTDQQSFFYI